MQQTPPPSPSGQADINWQSDPKLKELKVLVCTAGRTFVGYTYHQPHQRLLDALRDGFAANSRRIGKNFLPLTEVEVYLADGRKEYMTSTRINKGNIIFIAERSGEQPATREAMKQNTYPTMAKRPVGTTIHMALYTLTGEIHGGTWQQPADTFEGNERFIPLTNVEISPEPVTGESRFDFVAINKEQVLYIGEALKLPQKSAVSESPPRQKKSTRSRSLQHASSR